MRFLAMKLWCWSDCYHNSFQSDTNDSKMQSGVLQNHIKMELLIFVSGCIVPHVMISIRWKLSLPVKPSSSCHVVMLCGLFFDIQTKFLGKCYCNLLLV